MSCPDDWQPAFAAAILDPLRPVPSGLRGLDDETDERRFAVYRNNVAAGLVDALGAAFPVVRRLVGEEFFLTMARGYALSHPPRSPVMLDYGAGFADFIEDFGPAACLAYLPDTARLERAWAESYHAGEASPMAASLLAGIAPDQLADLCLTLHPSVRVVRSSYPVMSIWRENVGPGAPAFLNIDGRGEDVLIVRPAAAVEVRALPVGSARFIQALAAGVSLLRAAEAAFDEASRFDLAGTLSGLIECQALVGCRIAAGPS